jgi:hypothetical protein
VNWTWIGDRVLNTFALATQRVVGPHLRQIGACAWSEVAAASPDGAVEHS